MAQTAARIRPNGVSNTKTNPLFNKKNPLFSKNGLKIDESELMEDEEPEHDTLPLDEVKSLQERAEALEHPMPVLNFSPASGGGVLQRVRLVGIFPTARWLQDPTMPADVKELFGGTPFHALGEYRVGYLDLQESILTATHRHKLLMIVNTGAPGLETGYWGGAFDRLTNKCLAKFECTGELETTVKEESNPGGGDFFVGYDNTDFPEFVDGKTPPGICVTPFEKLLGVTAQFMIQLQWTGVVHDSMIDILDKSSRDERKQRARNRLKPR
mmetsp:Transcript_43017/g.104135  ORF Transcript_43017/g.104135 Transcript_43017/m.104135 type:complete len:270 (-) Transcript_43017:29-838(-)